MLKRILNSLSNDNKLISKLNNRNSLSKVDFMNSEDLLSFDSQIVEIVYDEVISYFAFLKIDPINIYPNDDLYRDLDIDSMDVYEIMLNSLSKLSFNSKKDYLKDIPLDDRSFSETSIIGLIETLHVLKHYEKKQ